MPTKLTFIGTKPTATSGTDVQNAGAQTIAVADQNLANLQAAVDGKAPLAGPGSGQAFATGPLTPTTIRASGNELCNVGSGFVTVNPYDFYVVATSNTNIKLWMRGTDGIDRSITLTLA